MSKQNPSHQDQTPNRRLWEAVSFNRANEKRPMNERLEEIRRAVRDGADLNMVSNYAYIPTPLIRAAMYGDRQLEILVELVRLGADLHFDLSEKAPLSDYDNAFQAALRRGQYKAASLLLDLGADINADPTEMAEFLYRDCFSEQEVEIARKMIMAGAVCGEGVLEVLREHWDGGYLIDTENYEENYGGLWVNTRAYDNPLRMVHLLEGWLAARAAQEIAQEMDAALPPATKKPAPHARRF